MTIERRYFWTDAPSPLHDALAVASKARGDAVDAIMELAKSFGAKAFAAKDGFVHGFVFESPPSEPNPYHWKLAGKTSDGESYYFPQRRTKEGKALATRMGRRWYTETRSEIIKASGMDATVIRGMCLLHTTAGWKDDRIFMSVPTACADGGDKFPPVPAYLTECKEWEMQRWFDVGREAEAA